MSAHNNANAFIFVGGVFQCNEISSDMETACDENIFFVCDKTFKMLCYAI